MIGRVLIIAGSDPSGGAGIQADIKTVTALGGYASSVITALTVQNTKGVHRIHAAPPDLIGEQIEAVFSDIGADAIKIGMIGSAENGAAIFSALEKAGWSTDGTPKTSQIIPVVFDPVMAATSGDALASEGVAQFIIDHMLAKTMLVTPNIIEASQLTGIAIENTDDQHRAGEALLALGAKAALVKGGHLKGRVLTDVLITHRGAHCFESPFIDTTSTHGTGCTLASAIATGLSQKMALPLAIERAIDFTHQAIKTAPGLGRGHGPLNHGHTFKVDPQ